MTPNPEPLPSEDVHHIHAAEGWLGLGNPTEAFAELEKLSPASREHPAAVIVRCSVHYAAKTWPKVLELADSLTRIAPEDPYGWLNRSHALHFMGRTQEAWDALLPAAPKFKKLYAIPYDLACYAAVLGDLATAREWLAKAMRISKEPDKLKEHAQEDPDLKDLWK